MLDSSELNHSKLIHFFLMPSIRRWPSWIYALPTPWSAWTMQTACILASFLISLIDRHVQLWSSQTQWLTVYIILYDMHGCLIRLILFQDTWSSCEPSYHCSRHCSSHFPLQSPNEILDLPQLPGQIRLSKRRWVVRSTDKPPSWSKCEHGFKTHWMETRPLKWGDQQFDVYNISLVVITILLMTCS